MFSTCLALAASLIVQCAPAPAPEDPFAGAEWLRDPAFQGLPVLNLKHKEQVKVDDPQGLMNIHTLLRKGITLRARPARATLLITGDDYYVFYINGAYAVQGPESGYEFAYPFYQLDVTPLLAEGANTLAAHLYYQGLLNRVWCSADNRSGFMLKLEVTYADGTSESFVTGPDWRCLRLDAISGDRTFGYKTQFAEDIDMRRMPLGWRMAGFDDSAWGAPLCGRQDHRFVAQVTPPLAISRAEPVAYTKLGDAMHVFDFGREIVGHTRIRIQGAAGQVIAVRHGEELNKEGRVLYPMRANCAYEDFVTLTGGEDVVEFFDYKGFRYVEVLDAPVKPEVWVDVRHHPFDETRVSFQCADKGLEQVWNICRNGNIMGSQGGFLDCPTREKGPYLGDAVITARGHMWLTGDYSLTRKCLADFYYSQQICPGMMAVAPGNFMQEIAEYSLQYPLLLEHYYRQSGDRPFLETMVNNALPPLFNYFARFENELGLVDKMTEKWVLVDWPAGMRDDYDYDYAKDKANTVVNAFYYGALRTAAGLAREVGRTDAAAAYDARADRVAQAFAAVLADPRTGLYLDAPGSKHSSLHANAIPLYFGLTAGANEQTMLDLIRAKRLNCGVYIASYVIEACFRRGAADLGYELLTSNDKNSWREMLRNGATACLEAWSLDQKNNASLCHPWSSSPIYILLEHVLGLTPSKPGGAAFRFAPPRIADLPALEVRVPHGAGEFKISFTPESGYIIAAPQDVTVEVAAPEGIQVTLQQNGVAGRPLNDAERAWLNQAGWAERVGAAAGVWVSVDRQMFYLVRDGQVIWQAPCSTAAAGIGSEIESMKTPLGWHRVAKKVGDDAPWGQVFKSQQAVKQIWKPGDDVKEDLVLTRVLVLDGLEPGRNQGKNAHGVCVDSQARGIYIHGTNGEEKIGTPASHGCIRLRNDDAIKAYGLIPPETPVLITQ